MLDSNEIRNPRTADIVRRIPAAELANMENAADLYWYTQNESLETSLKKARKKKNLSLNDDQVMMVAAAVAFGLWSWQSTPIMHVPSSGDKSWSDFRDFVEEIGIVDRLQMAKINLDQALEELARVNTDPLRFDAYKEGRGLPGVEFSDATIRDFYAAYWMARFMDKPLGWRSSNRGYSSVDEVKNLPSRGNC